MSLATNNDGSTVYTSSAVGKGKGRAKSPDVTEQTPLLSSSSSRSTTGIDDNILHPSPLPIPFQHRLFRKLLAVFAITLATCVVIFILLALIVYSYSSRASTITTDDILEHGLVVQGPDRLDVLNITDTGEIWVQVEGRVGVNAGELLGVNSSEEDLVWKGFWKAMGRWGIKQLGTISVDLSAIKVTPRKDPSMVLSILQAVPIQLTLTTDPPADLSWLSTISLPVLVSPTKNTSTLVQFAQTTWASGLMDLTAVVASVTAKGGGLFDSSWRNRISVDRRNIQTGIRVKVPALPGLPSPGKNTPFPSFSDLITLKTFSFFSDLDKVLIDASVTFMDPAPTSFKLTSPSLSFIVSIPSVNNSATQGLIPIAALETSPFTFTHPNVTVDITGHVLPLTSNASSAISSLLMCYLTAHSPNISIHSPLIPGLVLDTVFPAPNPKPQILRNVTIKDMKVKPSSSGVMLASGTVFASAVLPKGMNVALDVSSVFPELLVFDGPVPDNVTVLGGDGGGNGDDEDGLPEPIIFPDPLPERAFAHVRPDTWLEALSVPINPPEGEGSTVAVSAKLVDVPLEVLPGRQREFSNFVGKVIFGHDSALAGISGIAAVRVHVQGLPSSNGDGQWGEMELHGLPFQGNVRVGKNMS